MIAVTGALQANGKAAGSCTQQDAESGLLVYGGNNTSGRIHVSPACNAKGGTGRSDFESEALVGAIDTVKPWNVAGPFGVRRLMPIECERLMGFPDNYTAIQWRGKLAADGPRYKALGNSMVVPCIGWIGERITSSASSTSK